MAVRALVALAALGAALGLGAAVPGAPGHPTCAQAAGEHHAAIVVEHSSGATLTRCVSFSGDSISAQQAMDMSGVEYQTSTYGGGLGAAVCQVDYEPRTYPPGCWTSTSPYWGMYISRAGGGWAVSQRGISSQTLSDGDALGWHYQPQSGPGGGPPPSPAGVCAAAGAPPPAPAAPGTAPAGQVPAPGAAAAGGSAAPAPDGPAESSPAPPSEPATSAGAPSTPRPSASAARPVSRRAAGQRLDPGILAASLGGGALLGFLVLQLVAARLRP